MRHVAGRLLMLTRSATGTSARDAPSPRGACARARTVATAHRKLS